MALSEKRHEICQQLLSTPIGGIVSSDGGDSPLVGFLVIKELLERGTICDIEVDAPTSSTEQVFIFTAMHYFQASGSRVGGQVGVFILHYFPQAPHTPLSLESRRSLNLREFFPIPDWLRLGGPSIIADAGRYRLVASLYHDTFGR